MKKKPFNKISFLLTVPLILFAFLSSLTYAGNEASPESNTITLKGALLGPLVMPGIFEGDLRDLPKADALKDSDSFIEIPKRVYPRTKASIESSVEPQQDTLLELQENAPPPLLFSSFSTPDLNFAGQGFSGVWPPDTIGEVGLNYYIQMINSSGGSNFVVYNKSDGSIAAGPLTLDSLWTAGGACSSGRGDPVVLFDGLANRWLMSEFASTGNHLCVYISQTSDPISGGWYLYDFPTPNFPDYPKYAVWPDAYYVSSNEFSPAAYALERDQMLSGLPATSQRFTAPSLPAFPFQALLPSDLDGSTSPPAGSPNYFIRHRDGEVNGDPPDPINDRLEIWEFSVDWSNPANSTFTGPIDITVSDFDSDLCGLSSFFCFPQPGTTTTLDPLREVVMWRLQYRNFGTHETLVGNFVTDVDGADHGGIRWFELRNTGSGWTLYQEGTYAPDNEHRWMGSIAMDKDENIALGYSVSSSIVFPSIRYVGRLASDTPGTMPQGEYSLIDGTGSQTATTRWGDYSSMNVDPVDDCTFWYTNEYVDAIGDWQTQIGSFKFATCEALAPITQTFLTINNTTAPPGGTIGPYTVKRTNNNSSFYPHYINRYTIRPNGTTLWWPPIITGIPGDRTQIISDTISIVPFASEGVYTFGIQITDLSGNEIDNDSFNYTISTGPAYQ